MLSISNRFATTAFLLLLLGACRTSLPWAKEPIRDEVNLAFDLQNNLLFLPTVKIDGHTGRYLFASAAPVTTVDPDHAALLPIQTGVHALQLSEEDILSFRPQLLDLGGIGDAMIGADVWGDRVVSIDYKQGMVIYQKHGMHPGEMQLFRYQEAPAILVHVNGTPMTAIVDTTSPDTLVVPRAQSGRELAAVAIGEQHFGRIDIRYDSTSTAPRIGNRLLSKFLVSIDYGQRTVGLWRDPRIP